MTLTEEHLRRAIAYAIAQVNAREPEIDFQQSDGPARHAAVPDETASVRTGIGYSERVPY